MDSSVAAETVGSNNDLLTQILMRLPAKSLMCFKSVSNDWLLTITHYVDAPRNVSRRTLDPALGIFLRIKLSRRKEYRHEYIPLNPNHRFTNKSPVLRDFFTSPFPFRGEMILSSNGLLLLYDVDSHRYKMYNPTTLSYTSIPNQATSTTWADVGVTMAYDRVTSHYKLIFVSPTKSTNNYEIAIYSSETRSFNNSCIINGGSRIMLCNGVYWNDSVHWIVPGSSKSSGKILSFHVDALVLHRITKPTISTRYKYEYSCNYYFGESCGHLYYIEMGDNDPMMIYEMKNDCTEWLLKYRINVAKLLKGCSNFDGFYVLSLIRFEDDNHSPVLLLWVPNKVVKCNLVNRKFRTLHEFPTVYRLGLQRAQKYSDNRNGVPRFCIENGFPFIPSLSDT